jgi:hypothetical protein
MQSPRCKKGREAVGGFCRRPMSQFTEHCVKELTSFVREYGITDLVTWAVPPGMRPEQMNSSLERFVRDVAPRVKTAAAAA